jgi:hypothetical protein
MEENKKIDREVTPEPIEEKPAVNKEAEKPLEEEVAVPLPPVNEHPLNKELNKPLERAVTKPQGLEKALEGTLDKIEGKKTPIATVAKSIRTYASDVAEVLKKEKTSVTEMTLAESKKRQEEKIVPTKEHVELTKRNWTFGLVAIALIAVGLVALGTSFLFLRGMDVVEEKQIPSLIFSNDFREIKTDGLSKKQLQEKTNEEREAVKGTLGSIINLYLTEKTIDSKRLITAQEFLGKIGSRASSSFSRALSEEFLLGVHIFDGNDGFLIFKVKSFENAFAQMLSWETKIADDLFPIFYSNFPDIRALDEGGGTITGISNQFEDLIIENKDTRALRDNEGDIVLVYSFPDKTSLIITTNQNTLKEVLNRLTTTRFRN